MPIHPDNKRRYPPDWAAISLWVRWMAGWRCEFCGAANWRPNPRTGSRVVLTVAHMDHQPENCAHSNLRALCQRCHLRYDSRHHANSRRQRRQPKSVPLFRELLQ